MRKADLHIQELQAKLGNKDYFQMEDLLAFYQSFEPSISILNVKWKIHRLASTEIIKRIGKRKYQFGNSTIFTPNITPKVLKINSFIKTNFPYLKYMIWHISVINSVSQQQINKDTYYVEVETGAVDAVIEKLRGKFKYVLRGKANDYVYYGKSVIVVRSLIYRSPNQFVNMVPTITIEKLLVDLFSDRDFKFLQGSELTHIFNTAFSIFTINIDKLLTYAKRKKKREQISEFIKSIK